MDRLLTELFRHYPSSLTPVLEPSSLGNAGGLSGSRLWRYRSGLGDSLVRAWPIDGIPKPAIDVIHGWLRDCRALSFVPRPYSGLDGRTLYELGGRCWEIGPFLPGHANRDDPPARPLVQGAFSTLAAFHERLASHASVGMSLGLRIRLGEVESWLSTGFNALERWLSARPDEVFESAAWEWLRAARKMAPSLLADLNRAAGLTITRQPCLRDVRPEHFLFNGEQVTGLVDFGAMGIDCVSGDLARLLSEWCPLDSPLRGAALDAYAAIRPLDVRETPLIPVFERSAAVLGGGRWLRWLVFEGKAFDDAQAPILGLEKSVRRMRDWSVV